jgi:IclR family acetate operon transcriptional repressor
MKPQNGAGVQSLSRAVDLLELLAERGGHSTIGELAAVSGLPLPTVHRLLGTLIARGWVHQLPNRRYALGARLASVGAVAGRMVGAGAHGVLARLVEATGESANLAVRSGAYAEYVAQVPSRHAMRMFTEVGRRVELHCTGVGKAILAALDDEEVREIVEVVGLSAYTEHTVSTSKELFAELARIRERGYAIDEQEQELGVRCVAVALPGAGRWQALSVSGPVTRMTEEAVARAVPVLVAAAAGFPDS